MFDNKISETKAIMAESLEYQIEKPSLSPAFINSRIHIMAVNSWCITNEGDTYPAEIGLVEMTIQARYKNERFPVHVYIYIYLYHTWLSEGFYMYPIRVKDGYL